MAFSKVKQSKPNGNWKNDKGLFYSFKYQFEDGVQGFANHKQDKAKPNGTSVEYNLTKDIKGNNRISFVTQNSFGATSKSNASFALSYAKDLVISDKVKIEDIILTAEKLNNWLNNN